MTIVWYAGPHGRCADRVSDERSAATLDDLEAVLRHHAIDRERFEHVEAGRRGSAWRTFFGNFVDYSYAFRVDSDDAAVISRLRGAVRASCHLADEVAAAIAALPAGDRRGVEEIVARVRGKACPHCDPTPIADEGPAPGECLSPEIEIERAEQVRPAAPPDRHPAGPAESSPSGQAEFAWASGAGA